MLKSTARKKSKRLSRNIWEHHISTWEVSGLNQTLYYRQRDLQMKSGHTRRRAISTPNGGYLFGRFESYGKRRLYERCSTGYD